MGNLKIEYLQISDLIPYANNPRINDGAVEAVAASIKEFGFKNPIIVDSENVIVAGHTRLKAAEKLGLKTVPIIRADDLTEQQAQAFRLADNKTAELAEWDFDSLEQELDELSQDFDMSEFGFELNLDDNEPQEIVEDEVPEEVETRCKLGDIWKLGNHRLICGDSTDPAVIDRLMDGVKADMVFTDPPYGMNLDTDYTQMNNDSNVEFKQKKKIVAGKKYNEVIGDNDDFKTELVTTIFDNFDYCNEIFVWGADYYPELLKNYKQGNFIIWDKRDDNEQFDKMFGSQFEVCWSKNRHKKEIARVRWCGVFGTEKEFDKKRVHPTQKPIKLAGWFLERYSKDGDNVVDLFGGSGSTLIACEQLNRKCYMCELDEHYCDVIISRWENFTGKAAIKVN